MFTIFKGDRVYVRFEAGEEVSAEIKTGMKALVTAGSRTLEGAVRIISPVINPETGTREIKILINNSRGDFIPGSFARVVIQTGEEKERLVVPDNAVVGSREGPVTGVFIIRDDAVFKREVRVLYETEGCAVIRDGDIDEGELVCLDPPSSLSDGREVKIIQ